MSLKSYITKLNESSDWVLYYKRSGSDQPTKTGITVSNVSGAGSAENLIKSKYPREYDYYRSMGQVWVEPDEAANEAKKVRQLARQARATQRTERLGNHWWDN